MSVVGTMDAELLVRIGVGALLGGTIGYERDRHRRPVGLRTHLLVALAADTFMVISSHFVYWQHYAKEDLVSVDPSRIAASVVSAIGFIAGGAILRNGVSVQGLTTAAGLWLVAAIGMCAGAGMFVEGAVVTLMGLIALTFLRRFEDKDDHVLVRQIVVTSDDGGAINAAVAAMKAAGAEVDERRYDRRLDPSDKRVEVAFEVRIPDTVGMRRIIDAVEAETGVRRVQIQPAG